MTKFIPFQDFIRDLEGASPQRHSLRAPDAIAPAPELARMRAHLLSLYRGIEVGHSFQWEDGSHVDCVAIEQQPGLRGTGRTAASPPRLPTPPPIRGDAARPRARLAEPQLRPGLLDASGRARHCPDGTIPMRRITLDAMSRHESLESFVRKRRGDVESRGMTLGAGDATYRYAHAYAHPKNAGGSSWLNLWRPTPAAGNNHSLSQHWYTGGDGDALQSVEGGWQVAPTHYQTTDAVLFIYWTADNFRTTGAYNLEKPGFVQVDPGWLLGAPFAAYSVRDGDQREIGLTWHRDPANGNWWLFIESSAGTSAVGYYPRSLFGAGQMATCATAIDYGGEVTGDPSGQMGSGARAAEGFGRAAYQRAISYFPIAGGAEWTVLTPVDSAPCYTIDLANQAAGDWATHFFFGGPSCR